MKKSLLALTLGAFAAACAAPEYDTADNDNPEMGAVDGRGDSAMDATGSSEAGGNVSQPGLAGASDSMFINEAARSGMAEVRMGELARENGQSDAVKQFGERMVTDHTQVNEELKQVANGQVPTDLGKHQQALDRLRAMKGAEFDAAFKQTQVQAHQEAVQLFERQASQGSNQELKAFAEKHLPHLREHLTMAQQLKTGGTRSQN
jgi:putative membrane protein